MVTVRQLQELQLGPVTTAANAWGSLMEDLQAAQRTVDRHITEPLRGVWLGTDADAAFGRLSRLSQNFEYGMAEAGDVRTLLAALVVELGQQQKALQTALAQASAQGFTVQADGSVGYPADVPEVAGNVGPAKGPAWMPDGAPALGNSNRGRAQEIADEIDRIVRAATRIDAEYAAALGKLRTTDDLQITDKTWKSVKDASRATAALADKVLGLSLPHTKDPKAISKWWNSLTQTQRDEYLATHPDLLGALDGLPAEVRDEANRVVLRELHADLEQQLAAMPPEPHPRRLHTRKGEIDNPRWVAWNAEHNRLLGQISGLDAIQQHLDTAGQDGRPDGYLLGVDTKGNGHAIVANGNPDTARYVAVYVPGTFAKLAGIGDDFPRIDNLWAEANGLAQGQVSTVAWFGYDAPQSITSQAPFRSYADTAAPHLDQFSAGLAASHQGSPAQVTMIGHSYGSTVVGAAALHGHLGAGNILVAGSPGMEASSASDLGIGANHVWIERAPDDPVPPGGYFTELPGHSWKDGFLPQVPGGDPFGGDMFGGNNLSVDTHGHGGYWNKGSKSLRNQALVMTGQHPHG